MILDARQPETPDILETDVAVIGSGAAGLTLALAFAERNVDAVIIEAGGEAVDPAAQDLYRAASIAPESHGPVHLYRRRAFGGTTAIWGGRCIPFDPIDFEHRPWIDNASWPIGYEDVARHYDKALEICEAGPAQFTAEAALPGRPGPMVDGVASADVILDRIERFSNPTHFARRYRDVLAASKTVRVLLHANVTGVLTNETGSEVAGAAIKADGGRALTVRARRVVVAAGGLETPRILLASRGAKACGLGNERDQVGRYYQAHIEGEVGEIVFNRPARAVHLDYDRTAEGIYCRRYIWLSPEAQRREKLSGLIVRPHHPKIVDPGHGHPVLSAMYLVKDLVLPEYGRKLTSTEQAARAKYQGRALALYAGHARNIVLGSPRLAGFSVKWVKDRILAERKLPSVVLRDARNRYVMDLNAEQSPNPDSRIMLSDELDPLGMPRIAIRWSTTAADRDRIARGLKVMQAAFNGSDAAEVRFEDRHFDEEVAACTRVGGHHIGAARMAADPSRGVVDGDGQVFGTRGLYVAGAATFSTSGFANPTLVLVALAVRLAEHLHKQAA